MASQNNNTPSSMGDSVRRMNALANRTAFCTKENCLKATHRPRGLKTHCSLRMTVTQEQILLGLDSDTFYIYHVAAVMVDNLRRLLLGINLSDKAVMDFDFPGVGFPV